jgi:hypothetical protein
MAASLNALAANDVMLALSVLPEDTWETHDDLCDCTYQRIGFWTNPYIAETLEVRMCCIWRELYQLFPQYVRNTAAFYDYNKDEWVSEPMEWNGEDEMPKAVWYRQLARREGITVAQAREKYSSQDHLRPKGTPRPVVEQPVEEPFDPFAMLFEMITSLAAEVGALKAGKE